MTAPRQTRTLNGKTLMLLREHNPDKALDAMNSVLRTHHSLTLGYLVDGQAAILAYRDYSWLYIATVSGWDNHRLATSRTKREIAFFVRGA